MKKVLKLFVMIMLSFTCLSMFSVNTHAKEKVLTVGFDQECPPFGFVDNDKNFVGFDIDLAREAAKRLGYKLKLQPIDWDSKDMELDSGHIDCIWNAFTINGREDKYTWTKPYLNNSQVFVVRKSDKIKSHDDLKNKIVEVQKDSSAEAALESEEHRELAKSFKSMIKIGSYQTALLELEQGSVDAVAMDYYVARYMIKEKDTLTIVNENISKEQYGIGFKKGNTKLRDEIQKTVDAMKKDGTFNKISDKWFGSDVTTKKMTLPQIMYQLLDGMMKSLKIFFLTLLFSLPLGLFVALARMSKNKVIQNITKFYISIMRGTPLMLQMFVVYFGPFYLFNMPSPARGFAVIFAFVINYAAYFGEIFRSGIASMEKGQYEAAQLLGYSSFQTFFVIILPQVIKRILPSITNEVITLVKDTSLAFAIAYVEMFSQAKVIAANQKSMMPFVAAAIFYYVFNFIVAVLMEHCEKLMDYYD